MKLLKVVSKRGPRAVAVCLALLMLQGSLPISAQQPPAAAATPRPQHERVVVTAGRSTVVSTAFDVTRIAVTNPEVADAVVVEPRELLVDGRKAGTVSLIVWGQTRATSTTSSSSRPSLPSSSTCRRSFRARRSRSVPATKPSFCPASCRAGGAGSIDGTIPGRFWINLRTTDLHSRYSLADLTFHEAIPGHIWQGEYTHQMPLVRQMLAFNAYSEGWALYAEQLADELGAFENDPIGRLGYLQSIAFRACRLVVDTGLHAKRWTREQGVQFFVDVNGSNPLEVASEVDRYCSWPGQACGYKVGHSEINRQRDKARTALGSTFVDKGFNDTVVLGGNVPLDVLAKNVDQYIRTAKG